MSRWNEAFRNQQGAEEIRKVLAALNSATTDGLSDSNRAELERALKILPLLEARYSTLDPESFSLDTWNRIAHYPDWWVVCGSTPMNLYAKKIFAEPDIAYSLHHGLMLRVADRNYNSSNDAPSVVGYDAFVSHASEDKNTIVKSLAEALTRKGYRVWYDEFELSVGDSLRQSIDKGLLNSRFGIVVLSPAFFSKNWPQYELNGLTAREIDGQKVILPIWHNVTREAVLAYSPTLADKVALSTRRTSVKKIAQALGQVFDS